MSLGPQTLPHSGTRDSGVMHETREENRTSHVRLVAGVIDRRIQVVVMLLNNNSHRQISLAQIARVVNLSPGRLAHLFKSEMALSIQQYLTQVRLAKAKDQLETSFLSVKEIAASAGFPSVTRFVGCFKSVVGSTPAQYRKYLTCGSHLRAHTGLGSKKRKEAAGTGINSRIR